MISGGQFENHCRKVVAQRQRLPRPILISSRQRKIVSPAAVVATTRSASDSNLRRGKEKCFRLPVAGFAVKSSASDSNRRCRKGEWFRLQRPWRLRGPLPIPFSVAAKENGFACSGRSGNDSPRPILIFVAAKKNSFACGYCSCIDS